MGVNFHHLQWQIHPLKWRNERQCDRDDPKLHPEGLNFSLTKTLPKTLEHVALIDSFFKWVVQLFNHQLVILSSVVFQFFQGENVTLKWFEDQRTMVC